MQSLENLLNSLHWENSHVLTIGTPPPPGQGTNDCYVVFTVYIVILLWRTGH